MIEIEGVTVPRVLVTELAHTLVLSGELVTSQNLIVGLARGERHITLTDGDRDVIRAALLTPAPGLEGLRAALNGNTPTSPT